MNLSDATCVDSEFNLSDSGPLVSFTAHCFILSRSSWSFNVSGVINDGTKASDADHKRDLSST